MISGEHKYLTKKYKIKNKNKLNKTKIKLKQNKTQKKNQTKLLKLKGGDFIDKGGFGCVVKPALPCNNLNQDIKNINNYVSKIVTNSNIEDISHEIKISNILNKIDPNNIYFITVIDYCNITKLPKDRTDVINVKYKNDKKKKYNTSNKPNLDKKYCHMNLDDKPFNLILPFGGISLAKIMKVNRKQTNNIKSIMHKLFIINIKTIFKHLLIGLANMHKHKIVNKDIKQKNIMLYLDPNEISKLKKIDISKKIPTILDIMKVRYIDFGLSKYILPSEINKKSIDLSGTYRYLAPERYISYILSKYNHKSIDFIKKEIKEKTKNIKDALQRINEDNMITNLEDNISKLYKKINFLYENNTLIDKYYGLNTNQNYNSYIQKSDIYALGITMFDTLQYKDYSNVDVRENTLLYDLLLKMIQIDPDKRYNVVECINHSYFTNT